MYLDRLAGWIITLNGQKPSDQARQVAEEITQQIEGVVYVHNDLTLDPG